MKRKLLSVVAVAMAMSMTTSAFAATPRGTGDVDGYEGLTANDVFKIMQIVNGTAADDAQANVDGSSNGTNGSDARLLYNTILQPRYVSENLALRVYTENYSVGANPIDLIEGAADLGSAVTPNEYGTGIVNDAVTLEGTTTIAQAITKLAGLATDASAEKFTEQLDRISFTDSLGRDIKLRTDDGWAKLCWALKPIIPLSQKDADRVNRSDEGSSDEEIANSGKQEQFDALKNIRNIVVGTDPITKDQIAEIAENLLEAFPNSVSDEEVKETARRVLEITGQKYTFTADYNGIEDEPISAAAVEVEGGETTYEYSGFINKLAEFIPDYQDKTLDEFRKAFGDKVAVTSENSLTGADPISAVVEVVVKASYNPESGEGTTTVPSETTTVETPSETTTVETPSEGGFNYAPEATVEAGVQVADNGSVTIETVQKMDYKTISNGSADTVNGKEYTSYAQSSGVNTKITTGDGTATYRLAYKITAKEDTVIKIDHKVTSGKANYILKDVVVTGEDEGTTTATAAVVDSRANSESSSIYDTFTIELKAGETIWVAGQSSNICVYAIYA